MARGSRKASSKASPDGSVLDCLYDVIESRRGEDPESSHTARLFDRGLDKIAQKVGEEAVETVVEFWVTSLRLCSASHENICHLDDGSTRFRLSCSGRAGFPTPFIRPRAR